MVNFVIKNKKSFKENKSLKKCCILDVFKAAYSMAKKLN